MKGRMPAQKPRRAQKGRPQDAIMDAMMRVGALARVSEMHVLTPVWERSDLTDL